MEEFISSSLQGFVFELNLNSWISKGKVKVGKSHFIPSHSTFKKVSDFTQSITQQTINQSKLFIYYNIPKFRILGCYTTKHHVICAPNAMRLKMDGMRLKLKKIRKYAIDNEA